jgi:hypothetical protein
MISVVIATHESERLLVPTLAALVPAAIAGVVREVIVTDAGSRDATAKVADIAGCRFELMPGPLGARLAAAADMARARWILFLQPGSVPESSWIEEAEQFVRVGELTADTRAAAFQPKPGHDRSAIAEALALIAAAFGGLPAPHQGLLISKELYQRIGSHRAEAADPEIDLLRRLGRRRIARLRSGATMARAR